MTNPIIDALTWNPDNPAASIRALQTALMSLQTEWAAKIPQTAQISRDGLITEADWQSLGLDTDRADSSLLHFDNVNQEFDGLWANIFGQIQPRVSESDSGKAERFSLNITGNRVSCPASTPTTVLTTDIVLQRDAKFFIFLPVMINRNSGGNNLVLDLQIEAVSQYTVTLAPTTGTWIPLFLHWISDTYTPQTITVSVVATSGTTTVCEVADIAPLPNVVGGIPNGIVTPYLGYAEAIYQ